MLERLKISTDFINARIKSSPQVGIVLGSGLGDFVNKIKNPLSIAYNEIPGFKECSVQGHKGELHLGKIGNIEVAVMQGRFHYYEGYSMEDVAHPIRVLGQLGIKQLILTNAAGGMNPDYAQGQLVLIEDHINMTGQNPLIGKNIDELGVRFPDMSFTYCPQLRSYFKDCAKSLGIELKEGIYAGVQGPSYETPAEVKMLQKLGADLVGMSTVPEAIAAHHQGLKIAGISCVTNLAAGISKEELKHEDIKEVANKVMGEFTNLLYSTIENKFPPE